MKRIITITYALVCTLCLSAQILVIPDVHGRAFWKEAVEKHPTLPVVFLGDYLDPYARENITPDDALTNFKDIIAFKQANKDRVTLLIGNHEIHYFLIPSISSAEKIRSILNIFTSYCSTICLCSL